jgi:hypothetical protein
MSPTKKTLTRSKRPKTPPKKPKPLKMPELTPEAAAAAAASLLVQAVDRRPADFSPPPALSEPACPELACSKPGLPEPTEPREANAAEQSYLLKLAEMVVDLQKAGRICQSRAILGVMFAHGKCPSMTKLEAATVLDPDEDALAIKIRTILQIVDIKERNIISKAYQISVQVKPFTIIGRAILDLGLSLELLKTNGKEFVSLVEANEELRNRLLAPYIPN